jgi:hypothetical protein
MVRKVRDLYAGRLLDANYDCATSFAIFAIFTAIRRASLRKIADLTTPLLSPATDW